MNLEELGYPQPVIDSVEDLKSDINIDKHSFKGANGVVLFGYHKILRKRVALKYYYYEEDSHEEVQLLSQTKSSNIISILNARTIDNNWAFFMTDEVIGGDLDNLISAPPINYKLSINITRGILIGLGDMHKDGNRLLHRDLKPENILIDEQNNPLIADFGSVKRLPKTKEHVNASRHAVLYRPPESFRNIYDMRSDIYQVGIVMYQLLGGYLSYDPLSYLTKKEIKEYHNLESDYDKSKYVDKILQKKVDKGKLLNLDTLPPFVEKKVLKIIRTATHIDPDKRYQSSSEFDHALHKLGSVPDWRYINSTYSLLDHNRKDFRVISDSRGKYVCEKSKSGTANWRKEGKIKKNDEDSVVKDIVDKFI